MLSSVACIVDKWGGKRVVVTERFRMHAHVNAAREERLYVVPGLLVQEPVTDVEEIHKLIMAAFGYAAIANQPTDPFEDAML